MLLCVAAPLSLSFTPLTPLSTPLTPLSAPPVRAVAPVMEETLEDLKALAVTLGVVHRQAVIVAKTFRRVEPADDAGDLGSGEEAEDGDVDMSLVLGPSFLRLCVRLPMPPSLSSTLDEVAKLARRAR